MDVATCCKYLFYPFVGMICLVLFSGNIMFLAA
ncbi:hypothetical protein MSKU15_0723 [Komagataeibacter diospyri]|nr:hypothetical protein MSKU15_0723 [Komagataeibacter diospyri]